MEAEWRALWQPMEIDSAKPREMRAWLQQYRDLLECTAALRKQRGDVGELERSVVRVRSELDQALRVVSEAGAGPAESFTQLLERGGRAAARIRETEQGRKSLQQEAASLRPQLKGYRARRCEAEAQLTGHRGEWAAAVQRLGLPADATPEQANEALDEVARLFGILKNAASVRERIDGMEADATRFAQEVQRLAPVFAPEVGALAPESAAQP